MGFVISKGPDIKRGCAKGLLAVKTRWNMALRKQKDDVHSAAAEDESSDVETDKAPSPSRPLRLVRVEADMPPGVDGTDRGSTAPAA